MYIFPPDSTAANLLPSEEEVIEFQLLLPVLVCFTQVPPLSRDMCIPLSDPLPTTAANLVPSAEEVMDSQLASKPVRDVQLRYTGSGVL